MKGAGFGSESGALAPLSPPNPGIYHGNSRRAVKNMGGILTSYNQELTNNIVVNLTDETTHGQRDPVSHLPALDQS